MTPLIASRSCFLACLALAAPLAAAAPAEVAFVNPESFADVGRRNDPMEQENNLEMLRRHVVEQAARVLPAGTALQVSITDVDLAGQFEPWQGVDAPRIVRDIYPPRIDLRFRLARADGTVIKEGTRQLRDTSFLTSVSSYETSALRHEKALIDRWLGREFRAAAP